MPDTSGWVIILIIIIILITAIVIAIVLLNQSQPGQLQPLDGNGNGNGNGPPVHPSGFTIIKGKNSANDSFTANGNISYYVTPSKPNLSVTISAPSKSNTGGGIIYITNLTFVKENVYKILFKDFTLSYPPLIGKTLEIGPVTTLGLFYSGNQMQWLLI